VKNARGFTIIELCVVVAVIAILAVVTILYSRTWVTQYRLSNLLHSAQSAARTARMQAINQGRNSIFVITDRLVDSNAVLTSGATKYLTTYPLFTGDYVTLGPWPNVADSSSTATSPNDWRRLVFFVYNSKHYQITDVSSDPPVSTDYVNVEFRARGFPVDYRAKSISLQSKRMQKILNMGVTQTGKVE
jgi:prepilin-type N-terminal cleavage/methylation domain-containing protein